MATIAPTTLNPAAKAAAITLSNGNLDGTWSSAGASGVVRAVDLIDLGTFYFEVEVISLSGGTLAIGLEKAAAGTTYAGAATANAHTYYSDGSVYAGGGYAASYAAFGAGDVIGFLVDTQRRIVSVVRNGVFAGGGISYPSLVEGVWFPFFGYDGGGTAAPVLRANFGATPFLTDMPTLLSLSGGALVNAVGAITYAPDPDSPTRCEYRSTDLGAPVMGGSAGDIIKVLKACLVTGYGDKTPAGWTNPFNSGATIAVFQQGAGGNGRFFRAYDNYVDGANYRRLSVRGYEDMTGVSTGTGPFPTVAQAASNGAVIGTNAATEPSTDWLVVATPTYVYLSVESASYSELFGFGSLSSEFAVDGYNDFVLGATPDVNNAGSPMLYSMGGYVTPTTPCLWIARSDTAAEGAIVATFLAPSGAQYSFGYETGTRLPYPQRPGSQLVMTRPYIFADGVIRGRLPGLWESLHSAAAVGGHDTRWSGAAGSPLDGKTFVLRGPTVSQGYPGHYVLETSPGAT